MRVISKTAIAEFGKKESKALAPLIHWYRIAKNAAWKNLAEVHDDFPQADLVGKFTVFNIGGNKWRLVAVIKCRWQTVYVRHILAHKDYDKGVWKK